MPKVIDGRQLHPPEPFELTMAALDELDVGDEIVLILNCRPQPLYRVLQRNGLGWREEPGDDGSLQIHIFHQPAPMPPAVSAVPGVPGSEALGAGQPVRSDSEPD